MDGGLRPPFFTMTGSLIKKWKVRVSYPDKHGTKSELKDYFAVDEKQAQAHLKERYGPNAEVVVLKELKPFPPTTGGSK